MNDEIVINKGTPVDYSSYRYCRTCGDGNLGDDDLCHGCNASMTVYVSKCIVPSDEGTPREVNDMTDELDNTVLLRVIDQLLETFEANREGLGLTGFSVFTAPLEVGQIRVCLQTRERVHYEQVFVC
jgi:hypothetical protein